MGIWTPTDQRRQEIVEAALGLLAEHTIEALTTRQVARALGLTQPALFRHFRTREDLLLAVVARARADLEGIATSILSDPSDARTSLERLGTSLLAHAEAHPGLPRLLFGAAGLAPGPIRDALRPLVSMQAALVAELVRQGQREGRIAAELPADAAATLFVGVLQGLVLDWELAGRAAGLAERWSPCFALWCRAVAAGEQAAAAAPPPDAGVAPPPDAPGVALVALDVRPILARGIDPLETIRATLETLPAAGVLALTAPFRPAPLLALLARQGLGTEVEQLGADRFLVLIRGRDAPPIEDLRDREPPEPLERVLSVSAALGPGQVLLARTPRTPRLLVDRLRERPVRWQILDLPDGSALVRVEAGP